MSDHITTLKHIINPDQPSAHRFTDKGEIFFQDEFQKALVSICEHIDRLDSVNKSGLRDPRKPLPSNEQQLIHRHSTIGIFGPRGVGKTSFLLTITNTFDNKSKSGKDLLDSFGIELESGDEPGALRKEVWTLNAIDPSRIENEDKLLITITSKILGHVREKNDGDLSENQAIQDALEELSRRFRVLFPEATEEIQKEAASDPLRFAGEVLFDADSGPKLAVAFHRFVALAAEDLGVRCFLLPIDDVDTSFDKGWPLLETLRKYLATDRLITVVSGDLAFFDLIVQQEAHERTETYRQAESDYRDNNIARDQNLKRKFESIRRFPGQYLLKVFPVSDRVRIPSIHSVVLDQKTDLTVQTESEHKIPFGHAALVISRLLFGTAFVPNEDDEWNRRLLIRTKKEAKDIDVKRTSELSQELGPNSIDSLIPENTRRFISFVEEVSRSVNRLLDGGDKIAIADRMRNQIAESHSTLLQTSGMDVEDILRLANGEGFYRLNQALYQAEIGTIDLARLRADLFKDLPSYDQWRALLVLVSSALYADWSATMTGPLRYMTKVWDALSVIEQIDGQLDDVGAGLNEPAWKSRVRLLRAEVSTIFEESSSIPETVGAAMRVPRQQRNSYKESTVFAKIAPKSKVGPDYMRWWKAGWMANKGDTINARNRAVMPESKFLDYTDGNATALYGLFRSAFRAGTGSYRYVDFGRGLARIDDLIRDAIWGAGNGKGQADEQDRTDEEGEANEQGGIEIRLDGLAHEALDFVLLISGNPDQIPGSSGSGEEGRKDRNYFGLDDAVREWIGLARKLSNLRNRDLEGDDQRGTIIPLMGASVLPSPWVLVDAYDRFRTDVDEIARLPWRQQTVGTMLERYTMAFWNALLQKEILYRIKQGLASESLVTEFDFGPIRDNRNWIARLKEGKGTPPDIRWEEENKVLKNAFTRNVNAVVEFWKDDSEEKTAASLLEVAPYTVFWMSCPFLIPLLSRETHGICVAEDRSVFNSGKGEAEQGFLGTVYDSIQDASGGDDTLTGCFKSYFEVFYKTNSEEGGVSNRPEWQRSAYTPSNDEDAPRFDIHDIMCGIARPDKAPYEVSKDDREEDYAYLKGLGIVDA